LSQISILLSLGAQGPFTFYLYTQPFQNTVNALFNQQYKGMKSNGKSDPKDSIGLEIEKLSWLL
jgi:hypothetical protein